MLLVISYLPLKGQTKIYKTVIKDVFQNNQNGWSVVSITNETPYETYLTQDERYFFNLPATAPFGFTWVNIPSFVKGINQFENAELTFNFQILSMPNGHFRVGLTFDHHNVVTKKCDGGDFYNLTFMGNKDQIYSEIEQRRDCSYDNINNPVVASSGSAPLNSENNIIRIKKSYEQYDVLINDVLVLSFECKGALDFDNLYFEKGMFTIDDFTIMSVDYKSLENTQSTQNTQIKQKPNIYIVLAGINKYDNEKYKQSELKFPIADVESMYEFWTSANGGKIARANIIMLRNSQANIESVLSAASKLFSKANENDVIITFFSGHGGNGIFCAYDGSLQYERLNQIISASKASNKLFIVDACRSGSWDINNVLAPKGQRLSEEDALNLFYERLTNAGSGVNFLLACKPNESSADDPNFGHGAFTHYLLQGLKGNADKINDEDNIVTLSELDAFLKVKFEEWNKKNDGTFYHDGTPVRQTPILKGNGNLNMPVAVLSSGK